MKLRTIEVVLLISALAEPIHAQHPDSAKARSAPDSALMTPAILDQGRKLFHGRGSCFGCHGAQLQGGPIAPSLLGAKWLHIDGSYESIIHRIDEGKPGTAMVPHPGGITEAQVLMVATYVYAVSRGLTPP
jgi:mono/diheme cytochrome c family protein